MPGSSFRTLFGKALLGVLLVSGVTVSLFTLRLAMESRRHFQEAEKLVQETDSLPQAVAEYEKAARAYIPGNGYCRRALWKLMILGRSALMRGEQSRALHIFETVRRSILVTRHVVQPNRDYLRQAEKAVVSLRGGGSHPDPSVLVKRPADPSAVLSFLLFFGLLLWMGGAILLAAGRQFVPAGASLVVSVAGLALWISMAWLA